MINTKRVEQFEGLGLEFVTVVSVSFDSEQSDTLFCVSSADLSL